MTTTEAAKLAAVEVTDGGCYITVPAPSMGKGYQEIDLSLNYPALDDHDTVRANLLHVRQVLVDLQAAVEAGIREADVQLRDDYYALCEVCDGDGDVEVYHSGRIREVSCRACGGDGRA